MHSIGIIGCGRIAGHHIKSIQNIPYLNIKAVCDLEISKAEIYCTDNEIRPYRDYRKMLNENKDIQTVVIATPSGMHFEHSMEVMRDFGRNVIVEKPTFLKLWQLQEAYGFAHSHGLKIFPVFQNRFNRAVQRVKHALQNNELGNINLASVRVRWCRPQRYYDLAAWRGTFAMDGGALTNQGIHHVDLLRYLLGEINSVSSKMKTYGAQIEVEDSMIGMFETQSGLIGTLEVTTAARPFDFEASISLVGDKGMAQLGGIAVNKLEVFTPDPNQCELHSEDFSGSVYGLGHQVLYQSIANHFKNQTEYLVSQNDCFNTIRLLHSFYYASETDAKVIVEETKESNFLGRIDSSLSDLYRFREEKQ